MTAPRPYICFAGAKVVHLTNPTTRDSYCQFENNWMRAMSHAFKGGAKPYKFSRRDRYFEGSMPDCKNCVALALKASVS